ncbi:hypothetical protein D3C71_791990 [compost metagenome]
MAVFHQQMQQAIEQCQIGAGADLQEQAGLVCRGAAPWIDHDQFCPGLDPVHHAQKQDRVTVGHVGTDHEEQIGAVEVFVGARWPVGTQRELVAAARAGHAQARVGLNVVGADKTLGQFVDQVLRFQRHLSRHIKGQCIRPVEVEDVTQSARRFAYGLVHGNPHRVAVTRLAQVSVFHPAGVGNRLPAGRTLGAESAKVRRVRLVSGDLDHPVAFDLHDDAAAHTTIGAHTAYGFVGHPRPSKLCQLIGPETQKAPCGPPSKRGLHGAFVV